MTSIPRTLTGVSKGAAIGLLALSLGCSDQGPTQDRESDIGGFKVVQTFSPLTTVSEEQIQEGVSLYATTLEAHGVPPEDVVVLSDRLRGLFSDNNEAEAGSMEPVVAGLADIRQHIVSLEESGVLEFGTAALLAEVPGAIVCQRAGCPVFKTIGGRDCALIANLPWFSGWICVYLCNPF